MSKLKRLQYQDTRTVEEIAHDQPDEFISPFIGKNIDKPSKTDNSMAIIEKHRREIKKLTSNLSNAIITIRNLERRVNALERDQQNKQRW